MTVLDFGLFMLYRNCSRRHTLEKAIELMAKKIESIHEKNDVYLGLGTHRERPFGRYMVGSGIPFAKDLVAQQPLVVG
jgi:hypothetical protein